MTPGALLKPEARKRLPADVSFLFCAAADCDVVYFGSSGEPFRTGDVAVRVFQKVKTGTKTVCYCFDYSEEAILEDVAGHRGRSRISDEISAQVKAGNCFCEVTNPQGSCCLGNVNHVVKKGRTS